MAWSKLNEAEIVSRLTALIYEAALDPARWQRFVDALPNAIPGPHPVLYLADTQTSDMDLLLMSENWNHEFVPEYMSYYDKLNPWTPSLATKAPVGAFVEGQQLITTNDLKKTEFYTDFLSNFEGFDSVSGTVIHRSQERFAVLGIHSTDKMLENSGEAIARLQKLITPHLIQAFEISRRLGHGAMLATSLEYTLEAQGCASIVIDGQLQVYYANGAARALFDTKILTLDAHACIAIGSGHRESEILRGALTAALGKASGISQNHLVKISGQDQLHPLVAQIMPLASSRAKGALPKVGDKKQVLMIISDPSSEHQNMQPVLSMAFDLTASEANLAAALANGHSLSDYARAAKIQVDTARSQLKTVFSKTHTHRQAELVALIIKMCNPLKLPK